MDQVASRFAEKNIRNQVECEPACYDNKPCGKAATFGSTVRSIATKQRKVIFPLYSELL